MKVISIVDESNSNIFYFFELCTRVVNKTRISDLTKIIACIATLFINEEFNENLKRLTNI